jgi:hypothetical protein|tara:strand:- start:42917 stop:43123 length:207 start_codon:yes stop_codon:yes gene_type:complete
MRDLIIEYKSLFATIKNENNFSWHLDTLYKMVDNFVLKHKGLGIKSDVVDAFRDDLYYEISELSKNAK